MAAKHLFRHLHEPRALRKNALVRHLFEAEAMARSGCVHEGAVVAQIHDLVRKGAEHFRDTGADSDLGERVARQYAIVTLHCLGRRSIQDVAAELGVSFRHCYRERAEICGRIAGFIVNRRDESALGFIANLDEFRIAMDRARQVATVDLHAALALSDELAACAPCVSQKVQALRLSALTAMEFGDVDRAEAAYATAQSLCEGSAAQDVPTREVALATTELIACQLAFHRRDCATHLGAAQRAARALEPIRMCAAADVQELFAEALIELHSACFNIGDSARGYEYIAAAQSEMDRTRATSPRRRLRVTLQLWRLRNHLVTASNAWFPAWKRLDGLTTTFEQAYASGALAHAADALVALTEYHAFAGNDAEALRSAHLAIAIARQMPGARLRAEIAVELAVRLLATARWDAAKSFLPGDAALELCDAYHRSLATYFEAQWALRRRKFAHAWDLAALATQDEDAAMMVRWTLTAATAAHALKRRREAVAATEAALSTAAALGFAPLLKDAYRVAGRVTGDPQFRRDAKELATLLSA